MTQNRPGGLSRGMLERFITDVTVDDYSRHREGDAVAPMTPHRTPRSRRLLTCAIMLGLGMLIAVSLISTRDSGDDRQATRAALIDRVGALSDAVDQSQTEVEERSAAVDQLQSSVVDDGAVVRDTARAASLATAASAAALEGPGITVTLDDAPNAPAGSLSRVLDRDVQDVVNALWAMGAGGIAINDIRLTSTSAIRGAGDAVLVDYQPITRPYTLTAVGVAEADVPGSALGRLLTLLEQDYGLVTSLSAGDIALPAGEIRPLRFATPVPSGSESEGTPP